MKNKTNKLLQIASAAVIILAGPVQAQDENRSNLKTRVTLGAVDDTRFVDDRSIDDQYLELKLDYRSIVRDWNYGTVVNAVASDENSYVELTEAYFGRSGLFDIKGAAFSLGRQRYRDELSHWWDSELESIDVRLSRSLVDGFLAVGQRNLSVRTDSSDEPDADEEDILRLFGRARWQYTPRHFLESRWHLQSDRSGESVDDPEDFDGIWLGGRLRGVSQSGFEYSTEIIAQRGSTELNAGAADQDVSSWASLLDVNKSFANLPVVLGLSWHRTSAGSLDSEKGFRPTQIGSMSWRSSLFPNTPHRYGDASRFELSNLDMKGVYLHYGRKSYSTLVSFTFLERVDAQADVISSRIQGPLVNGERDLGYNLDFVASKVWNVDRFDEMELRFRWANFFPGEAFSDAESVYSRVQLEFIGRL